MSLYQISLNSTGHVVGVREVHGVAHAEGEPLRLGAQTGTSWLRLGGAAKLPEFYVALYIDLFFVASRRAPISWGLNSLGVNIGLLVSKDDTYNCIDALISSLKRRYKHRVTLHSTGSPAPWLC